MSSDLHLALLNLKYYERYKIAAKLALENKPRIEEENIYDFDLNYLVAACTSNYLEKFVF